jgi:hypothetical protein
MHYSNAKSRVLLAVLALAACTGCTFGGGGWKFAKLDMPRPFWKKNDKPDPEVPVRLVATWSDTVLRKTGETPKRGFGGRLIFFGKESEDPVRVEGQLVVYAFDDTDRPAYETQPSRTYIFPAEQFALHESDNKLGASYSVWLPWDDMGGPQRKISLIARFEPKGGTILLSEQTRHLLPGEATERQQMLAGADARYADGPQGVQLAGYNNTSSGPSPVAGGPPAFATANAGVQPDSAALEPLVSTMTIPLPRHLGARVEAPPIAAPTPPTGATPAAVSAPAPTDAAAASPSAATALPAERPTTVSLRDSLLSTLPARGVPASRPVRGRTR